MTQLDRSALKARNHLLAMFVLLCVIDITLAAIVQDRWAIGRILLIIIVMYFVIQGKKWAKWLLVGICSLLVVILIAMVLTLGSQLSAVVIVGSLVMAVLSTIVPLYTIDNKDLNRYFAYKRQADF
jgi:membrane-associated HD superfamily phosphohydrolase